jgi:L-fuculose-phosphate aldolase
VPDAALDLDRAAEDLLQHCHALAAVGLVTAAAGNASVRVGPNVLLTGAGTRFGELERDDLVLVDEAGSVLDGTKRPTSELRIHLDTYQRRPDVHAVMHTHGRHAVALSTVTTVVPVLHYYCVDLGGPIPVAPYRTYGTPELAAITTETLADLGGVVMAHHGSVTVGPDLAKASARAELLEWLCEVALLALAAGKPAELDLAALDAVRAQTASRQAR